MRNVRIEYRRVASSDNRARRNMNDLWRATVYEVAYRENGTAYESVSYIAENRSLQVVKSIMDSEGFTPRHTPALDLRPLNRELFD